MTGAMTTDTHGFRLNQTMLRIKDPQRSLQFYRVVLGMSLFARLDFDSMGFSLYFLGYLSEGASPPPQGHIAAVEFTFAREGVLELTHNWGTEADAAFSGYHNGNSEPRGFGHIGVSVPDVDAACLRFSHLGVEFVKRPDAGKMRGIAFIKDPDGYWIEILSPFNVRTVLSS